LTRHHECGGAHSIRQDGPIFRGSASTRGSRVHGGEKAIVDSRFVASPGWLAGWRGVMLIRRIAFGIAAAQTGFIIQEVNDE